ncbi:hypothetical protein AVV30_gp057 [Vibrio phage phi 1]|uniref:Uncharacterized protein n=1 Tax=Vibrio phage phi 1 TaxID=1589297 RepID=A0A0B5HDZ8_9CAUD|nr:hypothetical protein AVV30_gp057 [Vibrio phage phi 1]AJF40715.1 hypothetical protein SBVP1_0057 [Vibrio phage phi 1]
MKLLNTYWLTSNNLRVSFDYLIDGFDFVLNEKRSQTYTNTVEKRLQIKDFPEARRITRN